jgi:GNAT superfamily N-acetyltransferase
MVGTSIREVDDDADALETATRIALLTNGFPEDATQPWLQALARFPERARVRTFLATADEIPVATSTLFEWAGVAGLYNVGTLPEHRGRGLGTMASLAAMHAGRENGLRFGVLQASAMGESVYRSIGFEECGRFAFAVRGPRDADDLARSAH